MDNNRTVYKLSAEDLQTVASDVLERELSEDEITFVENKIGNYIDWYGAIENALNDMDQ